MLADCCPGTAADLVAAVAQLSCVCKCTHQDIQQFWACHQSHNSDCPSFHILENFIIQQYSSKTGKTRKCYHFVVQTKNNWVIFIADGVQWLCISDCNIHIINILLKMLLPKDDELVMSEMQKKWGVTDFVLVRTCPEEHQNLSKSGFIS